MGDRLPDDLDRLRRMVISEKEANALADELQRLRNSPMYRAGLEAAAKVCEEYQRQMEWAVAKNTERGHPSITAECKADAGRTLAAEVRALAK